MSRTTMHLLQNMMIVDLTYSIVAVDLLSNCVEKARGLEIESLDEMLENVFFVVVWPGH